uniref:Uncharacterized protein n=1 Tax=Vespula pensylvanica TaxID=30213 RepID=A0A834U8H6_VESPE|nr:hypothetical protein H0235_009427 [Vespula pensylvanica]
MTGTVTLISTNYYDECELHQIHTSIDPSSSSPLIVIEDCHQPFKRHSILNEFVLKLIFTMSLLGARESSLREPIFSGQDWYDGKIVWGWRWGWKWGVAGRNLSPEKSLSLGGVNPFLIEAHSEITERCRKGGSRKEEGGNGDVRNSLLDVPKCKDGRMVKGEKGFCPSDNALDGISVGEFGEKNPWNSNIRGGMAASQTLFYVDTVEPSMLYSRDYSRIILCPTRLFFHRHFSHWHAHVIQGQLKGLFSSIYAEQSGTHNFRVQGTTSVARTYGLSELQMPPKSLFTDASTERDDNALTITDFAPHHPI